MSTSSVSVTVNLEEFTREAHCHCSLVSKGHAPLYKFPAVVYPLLRHTRYRCK